MGYERDRDWATRGSGAIAAIDRATGARRARQQTAIRASAARDRAMAAMAQGSLAHPAELGALGRINLRAQPSMDVVVSPPPPVRVDTAPPLIRPPAPPAPVLPIPPAPPVIALPPPPAAPPPASTLPPLIQTAPAVETPPLLPLPEVAKPPPRTATPGTGGVMSTGGAPAPIVLDEPPATTNDLIPLPTSTPVDHTARNVLIVGGVALGVYLLLRKRGRS